MLWAAPEPLPSLTTFIYPHGGIGAIADTFRPFNKVVRYQPRELQQAPCLRVTQSSLELLGFYARLQVIFVNTDDTAHPRIPPITPRPLDVRCPIARCPPNVPLSGRGASHRRTADVGLHDDRRAQNDQDQARRATLCR